MRIWNWLGTVGWAWAIPSIRRRPRLHAVCCGLGGCVVVVAFSVWAILSIAFAPLTLLVSYIRTFNTRRAHEEAQ